MTNANHHPDYLFLSCMIILTVFGLVMLSSASSDLSKIKFNDTYFYLKHQLLYGLIPGIIGFLLGILIHYRFWQKLAVPMLIFGIIGLILVFTPLGFSHAGANRWLDLGPFSFQPAELLKIAFIIYLAAWLSQKNKKRQTDFFTGFLPFLIISAGVAFLIVIQPSTTTVFVIMAAGLAVYFASGAKIRYIAAIMFLGIAALALIIYLTPYRFERLSAYWSPENKVLDSNYHTNQALMAIGSGGLFGVGFGKSTTKFKYLPEPIGDSIFAVIAEELGFVGSFLLIVIFAVFVTKGFLIANKCPDQFAKLTVIGFTSIIAVQVFIHIAAISGLTPLTGVPLPFISHGGTSLAVFLTMSGIIGNISKYAG